MRILPLLIVSAVLFYSCDNKKSSTEVTQEITSSISGSENSFADTITATASPGIIEVDQPVVPATVAVPTPPTVETGKSNVKTALNPAHGQPNHRCDIAVGAPLNSAPGQNSAPQVVPQQNPVNNNVITNQIPTSPAPVQATGPKPALNPAHGQPHHSCAIAVGAPLS